MRVVLDTNVLISGVFFGGVPRQILEAWRNGALSLVFSPDILDEYRRVGKRLGQRYPEVDLHPFLQLLVVHGHLVEAPSLKVQVTADVDDEKFFACAHGAEVGLIVSGDAHLLEASGWRGIEVVSPADFLRLFLKADEL